MGQKMVCFEALRGTRSRQDESMEVGGVGSNETAVFGGRHWGACRLVCTQRHIHQRDGMCISGRKFGQSISASDFCSAHRRAVSLLMSSAKRDGLT